MASNTRNLPAAGGMQQVPAPARHGIGLWLLAAFGIGAGLAVTVGRLFGFRAKARHTPIIHEAVTLTPEGAAVWQEAMKPDSPVGKPVRHQRRRLPSGDA